MPHLVSIVNLANVVKSLSYQRRSSAAAAPHRLRRHGI
jgi:hypothetical protein